ncbi:MAG TPA: sigma-54 dependent transcriptional regulator [Bacteroidota bacterium]|nr:sigma-54 dependent transcriptional regulator [Bacteroidota bacterium]
MPKILLMGGSPPSPGRIESFLHDRYDAVTEQSISRGVDILRRGDLSLVLLDYSLLHQGGSCLIRKITHEIDPDMPIIVFAEHPDIPSAVEAMREGASDFVPADITFPDLDVRIQKALERRTEAHQPGSQPSGFVGQHGGFVFSSDLMKCLNFEVTRLANQDSDVLLLGETGVGKDLVAGELHRRGKRSRKPFIHIALQSLSETLIESELFGHDRGSFSGAERSKMGKFEAANGGTIYLPEISTLSEPVQLKLLSFMQYKTISRIGQDPRRGDVQLDVRLIMASNENLEPLVEQGRLREDFYYRITGSRLVIPPLRERPEDIELLINHFIQKHTSGVADARPRVSPEALRLLKSHPWHGNVRELQNVIREALVLAGNGMLEADHIHFLLKPALGTAGAESLPGGGISPGLTYEEAMEFFKRTYFRKLLDSSHGNIARAAKLASITPQGMRKILAALGER